MNITHNRLSFPVRSISLGGNIVAVADTLGIMQLNPAMQGYATRVTFAKSTRWSVSAFVFILR